MKVRIKFILDISKKRKNLFIFWKKDKNPKKISKIQIIGKNFNFVENFKNPIKSFKAFAIDKFETNIKGKGFKDNEYTVFINDILIGNFYHNPLKGDFFKITY